MDEKTIIAVARLWFTGDYSAVEIARELDLDVHAVSRISDMLLHLMDVIRPIIAKKLTEALEDL